MRRHVLFTRLLTHLPLAALFLMCSATVEAADVPQSFSLDGRLFSNPEGTTPLLDSTVGMRLQILDDDRNCILYEETQAVSTLASQGYFSVQVGSDVASSKRTPIVDSGNSMSTIFSNMAPVSGKAVADGVPCIVSPVGGKRRYVRIIVAPSSLGGAERTLSPDLTIDSVPNAVIAERAESVGGFRSTQLLKINTDGTSVLSQSNLESLFSSAARFNAVSALADGTSSNYMRSNSTTGAQLPVLTGAPSATPTQGSIWFDSSDQRLKFQSSGGPLTLTTGTAAISALSGDVSASGNGTVTATVTAVGGSTAGNVHAATVLANASTDTNTASTIVRRNGVGGFSAGTVSASSARLRDGTTNYVELKAPAVVSSYSITLPDTVGSSGQILVATDAAGTLGWANPNAGSKWTNNGPDIYFNTGSVGVGTASPNASALLDLASTSKGVLLPRMTTSERDTIATPANGLQIYNTSTNALNFYDGSAWQALGVAGSGVQSLGGQTGGTQTFAAGSAGTAPAITSAGNVHTLNVPFANAVGVTRGTISKTEYDLFNSKLTSPLTTKGDLITRGDATHVRLPAGSDGQVLRVNSATASGLEWAAGNAGTVTNVTSSNSYLTVATGTTTPAITANVGMVANTLAAGDDSRITGALQASAYATDVTDAAICTAAQMPYWNSVTDRWMCASISGLPASAISSGTIATARLGSGTADGTSFLRGDGTWAAVGGGLPATSGTAAAPGYAFNGDTNTGMFGAAADQIGFSTGGSERIRVDASGNVGIGTANPSSRLHVFNSAASNFIAMQTNGGYLYNFRSSNGGDFILRDSTNSVDILNINPFAAGGRSFNILNSNVGVGTSAPERRFHVAGGRTLLQSDGELYTLGIGRIDSAGAIWLGSTNSANPDFLISNSLGTERMRVTDAGNVGIGTTTPLDLLAINGAAAGTDGAQGLSVLYNATNWPRIRGGIFHGGNSSGPGGVGGLQIIAQGAHMSSAGSGNIHFLTPTGDSANGTTDAPVNTRMTILQNGNVGIGTTIPSVRLVVTNNTSTLPADPTNTVASFTNSNGVSSRVLISNYGGGGSVLTLRSANGTASAPSAILGGQQIGVMNFIGYGGTAFSSGARASIVGYAAENWTDSAQGSSMSILTTPVGEIGAQERMKIDHSGNVGIGVASPAAKLDVAGEVKFGNTSSTCNAANEGQQRYNSTSKAMEFCNGTAWTAYGSGSGGSLTGCPAGTSLIPSSNTYGNSAFCIETNARASAVHFNAAVNCASARRGLCTPGQIYRAHDAGGTSLTVGTPEWSSTSIGTGGTQYFQAPYPEGAAVWGTQTNSFQYRCCLQ